eukprot:m.59640 g.59640  ORF g.59640 m.59640 type:complete len:483 (-) comp7906_c1_seq1:659-2107(-)
MVRDFPKEMAKPFVWFQRSAHTLWSKGRVIHHFIQSCTSGNHGIHMLLLAHRRVHHNGAIVVVDKFIHGHFQFSVIGSLDTAGSKRFRKCFETRVVHFSVRVPFVIKQVLPLLHHALKPIVHHQHFDRQVVLHSRCQFGARHHKRRIAVNVNHHLVWGGQLGANRGREAKPHGPKTAGRDPCVWGAPTVELGRPHLVASDTCCDDDIFRAIFHCFIQRMHNVLGSNRSHRIRRFISKGKPVFPFINLSKPFGMLIRLEFPTQQTGQVDLQITFHGNSGCHQFVKVFRRHFKVNKPTVAFHGGITRFGGKRIQASRHTVVKPCAECNDEIGVLHGVVGGGMTVHTKHAQGQFIVRFIKRPQSLQRGCDGNVAPFGQLRQFGRCTRLQDALPDIQHGLLRHPNQTCNLINGGIGRRERNGRVLTPLVFGFRSRGLFELHGSDVFREVHEHRAGSSRHGDIKRLVEVPRQVANVRYRHVPFGTRA